MSIPDWLAVLFALVVIIMSGAALLRLILRDKVTETPILERMGLWWVLGSGYVSLTIFSVGWIIRGSALTATIAAGALAMLTLARSRRGGASKRWRPFDLIDWLILAVLLAQLSYACWLAPQTALGWDGIVLWEAKARIAAENGGTLPLRYFYDIPFPISQPRYPLFLPYTETWIYLCLGEPNQAWVWAIGPMTYAAAVLIIAGATERLGSPRKIGLISAAIFFLTPYLWKGNWNALTGYADFPLGVLYLAAASRVTCLGIPASKRELVFFGVLAGLTVWVKQEGFYLWLVLMAIAALFLRTPAKWREALLVAAPGILIATTFHIYLSFAGAPKDPFYQSPTPSNILANADRIAPVIGRIFGELVNFNSWLYLWIGAAGAIVSLAFWRRLTLAFGFGMAIGLPLVLFIWPFVLSNFTNFLLHCDHALSRLMFQIAPTAMLAIAIATPSSAVTGTPARNENP